MTRTAFHNKVRYIFANRELGHTMPGQANREEIEQIPQELQGLAHNTLVIGDLDRWRAAGRIVPPMEGFEFINITDLTQDTVAEHQPEIIISPLVTADFDVVDVAMRLIDYEFTGRYRAIADEMPDADLIRKEVRGFAPKLDFDLLIIPNIVVTG